VPDDVRFLLASVKTALLAVKPETFTVPAIVVVSRALPMLMASATVLFVPILIIVPAFPVPTLIVLALLLVPMPTVPVVPESRVMSLLVVLVIVPEVAKVKVVPTPVTLLESSIKIPLFWISLPVVVSKRTMALSVARDGPTTSRHRKGVS